MQATALSHGDILCRLCKGCCGFDPVMPLKQKSFTTNQHINEMTHQRLNKLLSFLRRHIYWLTASVVLVLVIFAYSWWHGRP
ncbi:MAG: hypothetical protein P8130_14280, partial [Deltaproteobacteria bacterium]